MVPNSKHQNQICDRNPKYFWFFYKNLKSYLSNEFDSEVSLHSLFLWPTVCRRGRLPSWAGLNLPGDRAERNLFWVMFNLVAPPRSNQLWAAMCIRYWPSGEITSSPSSSASALGLRLFSRWQKYRQTVQW